MNETKPKRKKLQYCLAPKVSNYKLAAAKAIVQIYVKICR